MYILYTYFVYGCRFKGRNFTYTHTYTYMIYTCIVRVMYIIRINILMNINRKIMS